MAPSNADVVRAIETAWDENRLDDWTGTSPRDSTMPSRPPAACRRAWRARRWPTRASCSRSPTGRSRSSTSWRAATGSSSATGTGTNQGGFPAFDVPANGNPFDIEAWGVYRLENGQVVEHWGMNDALTLLMQLGAIPAPGG